MATTSVHCMKFLPSLKLRDGYVELQDVTITYTDKVVSRKWVKFQFGLHYSFKEREPGNPNDGRKIEEKRRGARSRKSGALENGKLHRRGLRKRRGEKDGRGGRWRRS